MAAISLPRTHTPGNGYANLPLWREAFAGLDWLSLRFSYVYAARNIERGHGQPVVLVPGLLCDDTSLVELHGWLARAGYRPYYSHIGYIARCPDELVARLVNTIEIGRAHV